MSYRGSKRSKLRYPFNATRTWFAQSVTALPVLPCASAASVRLACRVCASSLGIAWSRTLVLMTRDYDVIVVGAGHAGTEASAMGARLGARVLLLTSSLDTIGQMSCNPAIGGIAKGTVVREIDALGGIMGRATDRATIQFRMLNRSKGPAVWAPRAQCDRTLYRRAARQLLERFATLELTQGMVSRLLIEGTHVGGIATSAGRRFTARAGVITPGPFLP